MRVGCRNDEGWKDVCPAGRAHCAWGGHFVACVPFCWADELVWSSRWSEMMFSIRYASL
jgi:hypothetical protein